MISHKQLISLTLIHVVLAWGQLGRFALAQITPSEDTPPSAIASDPRKEPGESGSYMEIFVNGEWTTDVAAHFNPRKPTLVLVHGWRRGNLDANGNILSMSLNKYWSDATTALVNRVNRSDAAGDINILGWNWVKAASTREIDPLARYSVIVPLQAVYNEGLRLAHALQQLSPIGKIHLLGHSLGAKLVGVAGCFASGIPLDQITLMDGPEIDTGTTQLSAFVDTNPVHLDDDLFVLSQKNIYVDSYASAFGASYPGEGISCTQLYMIEDASLFQMIQLALDAHGYPIAWYFGGNAGLLGRLAGTIDAATGDVCQSVGAAWSAVLNRIDSLDVILEQRRLQTQGADPDHPIAGLDHQLMDRKRQPYTFSDVAHLNADKPVTTWPLDFIGGNVQWFRQGNVSFTETSPVKAVLTTGSAAYLFTTIAVPTGDVAIKFDFRLLNPLPTDRFTFFAGDRLLLQVEGTALPAGTDVINLGPISLSDYVGRNITLTFCYTSTETGRIAEITNVRIDSHAAPEKCILICAPRYGHGQVFPKNRGFEAGATVTMATLADPGYFAYKWSGTMDDRSSQPTNTVVMDGNKTVSVQFAHDTFSCFGLITPLIGLLLWSLYALTHGPHLIRERSSPKAER